MRGSILFRLSDDIALYILSMLDAHVLWCMLQVNKRFLRLASDDFLWRSVLVSELGEMNLPSRSSPERTWLRRFLQWQRLESYGYEEYGSQLLAPKVTYPSIPNRLKS